MRYWTSIGWCVIPLVIGAGLGFALHRPAKTDPGIVQEEPTAATSTKPTEAENRPTQPPPAEEKLKTLDDLLDLAGRIGSHYRTGNARLVHALREVDEDTIVDWYGQLKERSNPYSSTSTQTQVYQALSAVSERLAHVAPEIAVDHLDGGHLELAEMLIAAHPGRSGEFLGELENPKARRALLWNQLGTISGKTPAETKAMRQEYIEEHGNDADIAEFEKSLSEELQRSDPNRISRSPQELFELLTSAGRGKSDLQARTAREIGRRFQSARAAIEFAEKNGMAELPAKVAEPFYGEIFARYIKEDAQAATAWISGQPAALAKRTLERSMWSIAWSDPEAAKELIDQIDPKLRPKNSLGVIASGWAGQDPDSGALAWYLESTDNAASVSSQDLGNTLRNIVYHDPDGVADFVLENPDRLNYQNASGVAICRELVIDDPTRAAALLDNISGDRKASDVGLAVAQEWHSTDPSAAREYLESVEDPALQKAMLRGIANSSSNNDWEGTVSWAQSLDHELRDEAMVGLLEKSHHDPAAGAAAASQWLQDAEPETLSKAETLKSIAVVGKTFASASATEAGEWATALPEGQTRDAAIAAVSESWTTFDPAGASEWMLTLPPGSASDAAVVHLVTNIRDDPVGAFEWGVTVSDPAKRSELLSDVVKRWGRSDAEAAREAIGAAEKLAPEERDQLLQQLGNAR